MTENTSIIAGREQVSVTINDQEVNVTTGRSILDAARHVGIDIPSLCHQEGKPDSPRPCLMCLVEVDGEQKRACRTNVAAGMVIRTDTPELIAHRKERLQELASHHYGDCKAPCTLTCPGGINVQGYINLIAKGEFEAALRLIKERNALPGIVCRVCPRFCETRCRRILLDEALSINHLKRFVVDQANLKGGFTEEVGPPSGHKVAIVGGGPAGLSCAYYLRKLGHEVYLFEAETCLGGLARYGIPNFKMPDYELDREIEIIIGMGVQARTGKEWGRDFNLADLRSKGFEAIFIACGMSKQIQLDVPGQVHIRDGLAFLRRANSGERIDAGSKVMVIGGTKIAIHAARSARRLGDAEVTVLYPRAKVEMPASQRDIDEAEKEGVQFLMMAIPLNLTKTDDGRLRMEIARTVLSEPDKRGKREPVPMEGSSLIWKGDLVINGLGQMSDGAFAGFGEIEAQLSLSPQKAIKSNPSTMATNVPGIYAGGEVASGARSVIQAVDSGRRAAEAIHKEMTGNPVLKPADGRFNFSKGKKFEDVDMANFTGFSVALAEVMPARPPERRIRDFDQVETGFSVEMAVKEAKRCLQCGCTGLSKCALRPLAIEYKVPAKLADKRMRYRGKTDHPSIRIDVNKCILCYRCERACPYGAITLSFKEKDGVVTYKDITINEKCMSCGACADVCPTGTLMKNHLVLPLLPGETEMTNSVCTYCGTGCAIEIYTKNNVIFEIKGDANGPSNHGELCVKGRFGFDFYNSPERLTQPLLRESNEAPFRKVSWYEALGFIADKVKDYQGDRFAALSSARCTNEDNYLLQKFTRSVMRTNSIDHCARLCHAPTLTGLVTTYGSGAMTNSIDEIGEAKVVMVIGSNTAENHPIIYLQVLRAIKNGGKLIVINPRRVGQGAHLWLRLNPGTDVPLLMGMARVIVDEGLLDQDFVDSRCEDFEEFKESLANFGLADVSAITGVEGDKIVKAARIYAIEGPATILYAMGITQHSKGTDNVKAIANLAMLTGNIGKPSSGVNPLRGQNNVQGACDMGALPSYYPGYQQVADLAARQRFEEGWGTELPEAPGLTLTRMWPAIAEGTLRAMYIMGENPVLSDPDATYVEKCLKSLDLLVVQDLFLTETGQFAHVVLPAACSYEKDGVFTNTERRVQRIRKAVNPAGDIKADWQIICQLAQRMGASGFDFNHPFEVMDEISRLVPSYGGINYERLEQGSLQWPCPDTDHPGTRYLHANGFARGRGKFIPLAYRPALELVDDEYPFVLTTGRNLYHYHTGTMTRRCEVLCNIVNEEFVEINPDDAASLGIEDGEEVVVMSRRGEVTTRIRITGNSPKGMVFMTFHFAETPTNQLTNPETDPDCGIPELKVCAVKIKKI